MAQFGWAYVNCSDLVGADGGIRYVSSSAVTASSTFTYDVNAGRVTLLGSMNIVGTLTASSFVVDQTDVVSGSTIFGNSTDDTHKMTGSLSVGASASAPIFRVDPFTSQSITTGFKVSYLSVSGSGLTSSNLNYIIGVTGSGTIEFRIHSASVAGTGAILLVKDESPSRSGPITLSASSGDKIDGATSYEISGSSPAISLYSNGSNWFVF